MAHAPETSSPVVRHRSSRSAAGVVSAGHNAAARQGSGREEEEPQLPSRRRRPSPWVRRILVFATCVLLVDALFGERGLAETMKARQAYEQVEGEIAVVRQENAALREQVRRLRDDPGMIESVAREELGLIKPGEILVIVK